MSTTDWMVETQLCELGGTSDTFVGRAYSLIENMSGLVFTKSALHYWGGVYCPQKHPREGNLTPPTPSAERAHAPALAVQGHNTREKALGEGWNEKGQRQAQKVTRCHSWFYFVPWCTTIGNSWTTPWDLKYEAVSAPHHPITANIIQRT